MKTLTTIKALILICSIIVVSRANTDHSSSHHDVSQHGGSIPQKTPQNTIVPFGIQISDHMLSTPDVACISADSNIFEIMNNAQETCNGTDMRCTFYHFVNHGYQNIGTLDVDKELFDDLLMKFDNWLLTAEDIETDDVPLEAKTKEYSALDTTSINANGSHSNDEPIKKSSNGSETERLYPNHGLHIDKVDHNINESDADKVVNIHNIKNLYDTHHRNHHHKSKNGNHIKLVPEYNNEHRYFEVFLPKDQETGKPRTIYVEVDQEKNEFVLLDEEIDKKLNGTKPIRIELDELSEIADTAFNKIAKSANHKEHIKSNLYDDEISDLNTNSALHEDERHLDTDVGECTQNILNVCYPNICNINANQKLSPDTTTGFSKKIINVSKNLVVPNKYINQAQFYVESQIDNTTDVIPNDHLELLESSNNETDIYQTGFNEETPLDTVEFNENNTNIDLGLDNIENFDILCDHYSTENYELSTENDNITFYDDSFIYLEQNNDTSIDIDFNDTYDLSSSETIHLNEHLLQAKKPVQENNPKSTPNIYTEPELTSSLTAGISDYISSQLDATPSENRQAHMDHSLETDIRLSPYTTVPLLGKDLANLLETDGHLLSSFPVYATLDLPADASQNSLLNYDYEHTSVSSYNSLLDSNFGHESSRPKKVQSTFPIFPSPPVECIVRLNKGSKYSPFNFGFSWLPSYSRVEELRLPCAVGPLKQEPILQVPVQKNKQLSDSICTEPTYPDHTIPLEDPRLCQTVPSLSVDIQNPYHLEANTLMSPKNVLPTNLDLPKSSSDLDRISTPHQLSEPPLSVMPMSLKDPANPPYPIQQISPDLHPTKSNQDLGFIKYSPFDNNSKEIMIPCAANQYRFPYTTIPYFLNPYIQPPQFITPYLEPILPVAPLQSASKILSLDSLPLSSDQIYPCLEEDYSKANKPIPLVPLAPNAPFSPLNPLLLGPGFVPNTLPYQNVWNNIPTLPCTMLLDQNIRNYPPIDSNHFTSGAQQNQILKPLLSNSVPLSVLEHSYPIKNILEMKPSSYTPFLTPVQMDLKPSLALEHDLQGLSLKYGIPLTKILQSLETEISDIHSKTSSPTTLEVPYSNLVHDISLKTKPNAALHYDNRSGYEESLLEADLSDLVPLDSSLIGPHLEIDSSLMLEANDFKSNTVVSETTIPTLHSGFENQTTKLVHDSSLISPHLPTQYLSHFDENRSANEVVISESDYSNSLDSSLIGPHLEIGSPPILLNSNNSQGDILTSHTEVPITISSQIEPKLNLNHPTHLVLDSSLIGSHLPSLSTVKPILSDEIQNINDMIPLGSDLTDLTPLNLSVIHTQEDLVNQLDQTEIFKHENTAVTLLHPAAIPSTKLPPKYFPKTLMEEKLLLQSDSLIPLDSSLIGPELKLGSSPIITDSLEDKTVPPVSKQSLQNTDNKLEELESINLPSSSLLTTLLKKSVKADSNLNIITQETKINKELNKLSTDTNVELPLTDISQTYQETDFKIVEPILELTSLIDNRNIPLVTKDSITLKNKSDSLDTTHDYGSILDHSITGTSTFYKLENPEISTSVDSSIHLDSSLVGPSILQEIDSRAPTTIIQNKKPTEISTAIDSLIKLESSFKGPTLNHEINSKETSSAFETVTQFESSSVPSLHETKESSATASVLNSSQLDRSFIGPSLHREKVLDSKDILDGSLVGPHLLTAVPFSGEEIQMINEELQSKFDLVNLIPLDSSLIGPHIDFESELEQSEISRYQNPELIKTSASNLEVSETRDFAPSNLDEEMTPLEPIIVPSLCTSDHQELSSKFTNAVTKTQLSPFELKPCDKLLSSIAKISSDNYVLQSGKDLQTLTLNTLLNTPLAIQDELASEFSPITMTSPAQDFLPVESIKYLDSNIAPTPKMLAESLPYAQGVPHIPPMPYSPFLQMKPLIDRNWLGLNNIQNILQNSPSFRPVVGNAPIPFISNALPITSEYLKSILDLPSYSKLYPQLSIPDMYTPGDAIALASECTKTSNNLPLNENIPSLPKNNFSLLPSNLESTVSKSEYKPIVVDDIMSFLDENSLQLLKDMSILPFRESFLVPTTPFLKNGEIISPSLLENVPKLDSGFIQTRPLLPIPNSNPLVPPSTLNPQIRLFNPQNVPFMIHAPNISPCSLQTYSNLPLHSEYSEIIGPAPKIASLPTEYPKALLQEQLSKPCVESSIILPNSSLDTMLQLPTASNELNTGPCQLPPEYFIPMSPIYTNPLTSPILPIYVSPLSVFYPQSSPTPSTSLALNVPYRDSPLRPVSLPINPYTDRQLTPKYSSPVMSDYPHPPTVAHNIPIPLEIPYNPSQTYSSPYLPGHPSRIPIDTSAGSPIISSKLPPAITSPISPPLSTPYFTHLSKSLTSLGSPVYSSSLAPIALGTLAQTPTGPLVPSYLSPTNSYSALSDPINAQTRLSNLLSPSYITSISPVSSSLSSYNTPITLNPISSPNPQIKPEIQTLGLLNTLPITNAVNPFLHIKQRLPKNPNILPIQSYITHVPTSNYNKQIKQNIPCQDSLESNLLTSVLTEELPMYDVIEENAYTYSNDKYDKYYEDPTLKYPLESLSYTLAPEEITEYLPYEDYMQLEDLSPSALVNNLASEPSLQRTLLPHHHLVPYTSSHSKPVLKLRPAPKILQPPSSIETIPQNIYDNTPLVSSFSSLKHAVSLPTSILSSPILKTLSPLTIAPIDTPLIPYNNVPLNEKLQFLSSSPFYSGPSQDMSSSPIYPTKLRNIVVPQVIPASSQVSTNAPVVTVSSPMNLPTSQLRTTPHILDNHNQLPSTHYEPRLQTFKSPGSLIKPSPTPTYTQFAAPIISHVSPLEMPITSQFISSSLPESKSLKKAKSFISPQYISSILPTQATLQDSLPLNKAPIPYQPYIEQPTALTSSANNVFRSPPVASPYYSMLPSVNMVEPDLNRPQSFSFTPQYSLQSSPLSVSQHSPTVPHSNIYSRSSTHMPKKMLTNNIIPSSLFMSSDTDFQPTKNRLAPLYNIPRYSSPTPFSSEPLHTDFFTPSRPLDTTAKPKNILKPKSPMPNVQYTVPLPSSLQPLQPVDSYQIQPHTNVQYAAKTHRKSSPLQAQYASLSLAPMYTSLPLETTPKQLTTKPSAPHYSLSSVPVYDSQIHSLPLGRNPFLNPDFKLITEVPSYPVSKNVITSSILAPSESILLSSLRNINISPESQNSYSVPITYSTPLIPSSLLKPSAERLSQNSGQYRPHICSNSQFVSQSPITYTPLETCSLLQPLLANSQNNAPLEPMHFSNTNTAFPEGFPIESVPSVTSPGIAFSNYLPYDSSDYKYSGPCVSEIFKLEAPINPSTTTPYIFSKPPFDKYFKSPVSTQTNIPLYSIDDILEPSPEILAKANILNTVLPIEISGIRDSQSSPVSLDSLDIETIEEIEPNELIADLKGRSLILGFNKQGQSHPVYASNYFATPQPTITMPSSKYKATMPRPSFSMPSLTSEEAELTNIKDLITLSQIKSEPLIEDYSPSERKAPNTPSNIQEPDIVQLTPYNSLLNSEFPPTTYKQIPPNIQTPRYINQIQKPSPVYLSPQEYKDLIQGLSTSQSPFTHFPQLTPSPLTGLSPQIPLYTSFMSIKPENWLDSPIFVKSLPLKEKLLKVTPEKENVPSLHNKYKIANKMTPQGNKYVEPKSTISEMISELDSINPLLNSKEPYTKYIDDLKSNKDNYYEPESDNVIFDESKPDVFEAKPTKNVPELSKGLSIPNYIRMVQRPRKLSKLDHFYANNHIGKGPQVFNVPTSPIDSPTDVASPYTITSSGVLKDSTVISTKHFASIPKLDTASASPSESYAGRRPDSPENVPITNSYHQYYLNPYLKCSSQTKSPPNTIEIADTSEITPTSYNFDDIKYSGYKTYHIPSFKSPLSLQNLGASNRMYSPSLVPYSSPIPAGKPLNIQETPSLLYSNLYSPPVIYEPPIPQYQTPIKMTTPLQTKLGLEPILESPELNEYNPEKDIPTSVDSIHEDNELKTSLINYINKREDFKNNNAEVTIPIGNIAITRKEPYNANTVETSNPSIGIKVWKSNIKIAQAELKLKFKDLSVNNFMPIVNNLDKYDLEEIRKIVKNYIDEKYGNHIEINEPYTIDNKYTVIKDFDPNGVDSKYNLLWPTNYV